MKRQHRRRGLRRRGLTLLEILVVLFLTAIVAAVLVPTIFKTRGRHGGGETRVRCGSNLRQIGQAILMYTNENHGSYPRVRYTAGAPLSFHWDAGNGGTAVDPFQTQPWAGYENDPVMAMFLLIRTQDITSEVFVCTSSYGDRDTYGAAPGARALNKASFSAPSNLTYSLANPYADEAAVKNGWIWNSKLGAEFVVAADLNPGIGDGYDATLPTTDSPQTVMRQGNSRNHQGAGQNVLYGDGHVSFEQTPFCGARRDNIYTVSGTTDGSPPQTSKVIVGSPKGGHDSVLLPTAR
jgi:prepilin-type N-terminal cleavage/methylation domain-containing protein/prepilin-type processing-associated H-X9-DG protein